MVHIINAQNVINFDTERHYVFHTQIDSAQYPQVHDFYELTLMVKGKMGYILNGKSCTLTRGDILLIRPGDVHTKIALEAHQHINLAFPVQTINNLFEYLYSPQQKEQFLHQLSFFPVCTLSNADTSLLQEKLARLNFLSPSSPQLIKTTLRKLLLEVISDYFMPAVESLLNANQTPDMPLWMLQCIEALNHVDNLASGMDFLVNVSKRSPEHICRAFQKYLHITPVNFINAKRLVYAANLLSHTDKKIVDIAFEVGFLSLSHFYKIFKLEFHMTPLQYRHNAYLASAVKN